MKLPRPFRVVAALIALCSLLFTQLAVASYACPMFKAGGGSMSLMAQPAMSDCSGMDMAQPGLCAAFAHEGNQSLDKPEPPPTPPFVAAGLIVTLVPLDVAMMSIIDAPFDVLLARATAPPLAIRHCCFRI